MKLAEIIEEFVPGEWGYDESSLDAPNNVACIRGADFVPILNVDYSNIPTRYISDSAYNNKRLKENDIIIEKSGGSPTQSTGRVVIVTHELLHEKPDIVCSNFCEAFRVKKEWNPFYVFSYLQYLYNEGVFFNFEGKTSGLKNLQIEQAFSTIDIPEQKSDISILISIDEKIALNKKINKELEALAEKFYDYWFVQFDFPNEEGKPYKSSGGKMIWNEILKKEIPDSWVVSTFGEMFDVKLGGTPSTKTKEYWNGDIHWLSSGEMQNFPICKSERKITEMAINNSATVFLRRNSVLISITRYLRVTILNIDACINQSVVGFEETEKMKKSYTYFALSAEIPRLNNLRTGAQQPHISKDTIENSPILVPNDNRLQEYYAYCEPLFLKLMEGSEEIEELQSLRDYLLPLLMNGQVTIKE